MILYSLYYEFKISKMSFAIGIDLGTEYVCVGVYLNGKIDIIPDEDKENFTPSCVAFTESGRLIGAPAKAQYCRNPENTVFNVKRLLGRKFDDPAVQEYMHRFPINLENQNSQVKLKIHYKNELRMFTPEGISAMILRKVKEMAEVYLGVQITTAVITVPAYFNDSQRQATIDAGRIANFDTVHLLNEPMAAAIAYGFNQDSENEKNILVVDIGTGKVDLSILTLNKESNLEVKATQGNTHLGGIEFTGALVDHFVVLFKKKHNQDLRSTVRSFQRLKQACQEIMERLCEEEEATMNVNNDEVYINEKITRDTFEKLCDPYFFKIMHYLENVIKDSKIHKNDIHDIILVGGCTKIPKVQTLITEYFNGKEICSSINPDEAVAFGAAIQAALLSGRADDRIKDILLIDVLSLSIGVEVSSGKLNTIIPRNTRIPFRTTETFTTHSDDQSTVSIQIYEGERPNAEDNNFLGQFDLVDLPPLPKGALQIEVIFEVNREGILTVSATEKENMKSESLVVRGHKGRLTEKEIKQKLLEVASFEEEDKQQGHRAKFLNAVENFLQRFRETVVNLPLEKISALDKKRINDTCVETLQWVEVNTAATPSELEEKRHETYELLKPYQEYIDLTEFKTESVNET